MERKELIEKLQAKHAAAVERARATLVEIAGVPGYHLETRDPAGPVNLFHQLSEDWKRCEAISELIQNLAPRLFQEPETAEQRNVRLRAEAQRMGLTGAAYKHYVTDGMGYFAGASS